MTVNKLIKARSLEKKAAKLRKGIEELLESIDAKRYPFLYAYTYCLESKMIDVHNELLDFETEASLNNLT